MEEVALEQVLEARLSLDVQDEGCGGQRNNVLLPVSFSYSHSCTFDDADLFMCACGVDWAKRDCWETSSNNSVLCYSFPSFPSMSESDGDKEYSLITPFVELSWKYSSPHPNMVFKCLIHGTYCGSQKLSSE